MLIFLGIIAIAFLTAIAAVSRGRSSLGWFILGLLFNFFALAAVLIMPSKKIDPLAITPKTHFRCPDCKEFVRKEANICKHCGCKLVVQTELEPSKKKTTTKTADNDDQPNVYIIK